MTPYHSQYWAHALTLKGTAGSVENLSRSISNARVDLNPHQVDAALFALRSPLSRGVILADEVGLGKTIEAGLVIAQRWAERRRRILLIVPATLRKQWEQEIHEKFYLPSVILDSKAYNRADSGPNPFDQTDRIIICSYHFASAKADDIARVPWDLVVLDEAHKLRNAFKPSSRMARRVAEAVGAFPKLLLTATPLQNSLMELYGLVSSIDPHVFGDAGSFRDQFIRFMNENDRNVSLRDRLRPICIRTLRKQVVEYIPFTRRVPITQDFRPSDKEHALYEMISDYLRRERLIALPASQRALITLVLRKLLASSSFAIAATLRRLVARLEDIGAEHGVLDDDDLEGIDELVEEWDETENGEREEDTDFDPALLKEELAALRRFADVAEGIRENAKGEALIPALQMAFERAEELGAQRKAVIFTESRRTQEYLFDLLSARGYQDELVLMNGSNSDPQSKAVYEAWRTRNGAKEAVRSSRAVDIKAAIVDHFRDGASILIATEAAAEGVNLQFCSLVINFDLPWNPQRIEQRIGRCHRYGQKHDVVVVNFLNRRNDADRRVHQLLSEKFKLFDGVFGASDEVLGALESGVDIERRIAQVYQTCRTPEEIGAAFDALQAELDAEIQARMAETRQALLEYFDEDVSERLRVRKDRTLESLSDRERWLLNLTRVELNGQADFDPYEPRFRYYGPDAPHGSYHLNWKAAEDCGDTFYRLDHPLAARLTQQAMGRALPVGTVTFDYAGYGAVVSVLKPLVGRSGWLEMSKLTVETFDTEEFLVFAGCTDDGGVLDDEVCRRLFWLPSAAGGPEGASPDLTESRQTEINRRLRQVEERNSRFFDEEVTKLDRWSDDLKQGLEREIKELDKAVREARKRSALAATLQEKLEVQREVKELEATRNRKRRELFEAQDRIDEQRNELIQRTERQLQYRQDLMPVFSFRWKLHA